MSLYFSGIMDDISPESLPPTPIHFSQYSVNQSIIEPTQKSDCRKSLLKGNLPWLTEERTEESVPEWALDIMRINQVMTETMMEIGSKLDVIMSDQRKIRKELAVTQKCILEGQEKMNLGSMDVNPNESMVVEVMENKDAFDIFEREMMDKNVFQKHVSFY